MSLAAYRSALVVEPDPDVAHLLSLVLRREGVANVVQASDGITGLALALAERPSIILSEIVLPNMDGIKFLREVRSTPATAGATIVILTAQTGELLEQQARELSAALLIRKPVSFRSLAAILEAGLARHPPPLGS